MTVLGLLPAFPSLKKVSSSHCDDWVDRLSHGYSVFIIIVFAILVSVSHLVGPPIQCWIPAEFDSHDPDSHQPWEHYIHNSCWMKNTYFIPMEESIPTDVETRKKEEITYYQWVPLILLSQAFLFKLTHLIWKLSHTTSGINIHKLTKFADAAQTSTSEGRKFAIESVIKVIDIWIYKNKNTRHSVLGRRKAQFCHLFCFFCNKRRGNFLVALYLFIKVLYLANVIGQIFLLNAFITTDGSMYGLEWLQSFNSGPNGPVESHRFPRVTLCDFEIRQLNNIQTFTVQCVLPINLFNEKIFLILWFWFVLLALLAIYNLLRWIYLVFLTFNNYQFVKKYLKIANLAKQTTTDNIDKDMCHRFATEYLRNDGCFVIRMIGMNTSDMIAMQLVEELYDKWLSRVHPHISNLDNDENEIGSKYDSGNNLRKRSPREEATN